MKVYIIDDTHQEFNGQIYGEAKDNHYYRYLADKTLVLHREVWKFFNGEIPKGYVVHHADFNHANNDISNLQLVSRAEHIEIHRAKVERVCEYCGKTFLARAELPGKFCSRKCADRYKYNQKQILVCVCCGKEFETRGRSPSKTCSPECAHALSWENRGNSEPKRRRPREIRSCVICGKEFETRADSPRKTCSIACTVILREQHRPRIIVTKKCLQCGAEFKSDKGGHAKYCSRKCLKKAERERSKRHENKVSK